MASCCEVQVRPNADTVVRQVEHYSPDVDIYETEEEFILSADVPGSSPEGVNVEYDKGKLIISAKAAPRPAPEGAKPLVQEYGVSDFYRSFEVSESVDVDSAEAKYTDGVLTVTLKKKRNLQRKIPIQVN